MAPVSGRIPRRTKDVTSVASVDMTTRSQASTRLAPAPTAAPWTAPMTGLSQSNTALASRCQPFCSIRARSPGLRAAAVSGSPRCGPSPAPLQKCLVPDADKSTARTSVFWCASRMASVNASRAKGDNELPTSARSMTMR